MEILSRNWPETYEGCAVITPNRHSIRLPGYDYGLGGAYFVTICVSHFQHKLGEVINGEMQVNAFGEMVAHSWSEIQIKYPTVSTDLFCVMPNHVHAIISIFNARRGEVTSPSLTAGGETPPLREITLGQAVAFYKYETTKKINAALETPGRKFWQRNYYERVIRNDREYEAIHNYILANPANWSEDEYHHVKTQAPAS